MTFALLFLSLSAFAAEVPSHPPVQEPVRYATVRGTLEKHVLTHGSYLDPVVKVCDFEAKVGVYGPLEPGKSAEQPMVASCESVVGGKPARVQLNVNVMLDDATGDRPAEKSVNAILFVSKKVGKEFDTYSSQIGYANGDVDARRIGLNMYAAGLEGKGIPEKLETFAAILTVVDEQQ